MVVCTDHNIDLLKASSHNKTQEFLENCVELNLLLSITKPIRITHSSATLIDNIFLSARLHDESMSWILVEDMSDHFPCRTSIPYLCPDNSIDQYITKRKLTDKVYDKTNQLLNQVSWNELLESRNCNDSFNTFHDILQALIDEHAPEKSVKISYKSVQPWMSKGLLKCLTKQKKLYCKASKLPKEHETVKEYKKYRLLLQKIIRKAKMSYYSDKCVDFKNNTKKLWNVINKLTGKTVNKHNIIDSLSIDQKLLRNSSKLQMNLRITFPQSAEFLPKIHQNLRKVVMNI